jgi:hypothetical protein
VVELRDHRRDLALGLPQALRHLRDRLLAGDARGGRGRWSTRGRPGGSPRTHPGIMPAAPGGRKGPGREIPRAWRSGTRSSRTPSPEPWTNTCTPGLRPLDASAGDGRLRPGTAGHGRGRAIAAGDGRSRPGTGITAGDGRL